MNHPKQLSSRRILAIGVSSLISSAAHASQISDTLKDSLLTGYMLTCVPTIKSQLPLVEQSKINSYCSCVGGKTFQNITNQQYDYLKSSGRLPPEIEAKRGHWESMQLTLRLNAQVYGFVKISCETRWLYETLSSRSFQASPS